MKRILCYGDSNTWGAGPDGRIEDAKQWPTILQTQFGSGFKVIQEGLCARVAGDFDTVKPYLNGKDSFEAIYRSAAPISVVIVALGTNDLKRRYGRSDEDITNDLLWYKLKVSELTDDNEDLAPQVIYIAPSNFKAPKDYFDADEAIRQGAIGRLKDAHDHVIIFNDLEMSSDGIHYSEEAHEVVAAKVFEKCKELNI